MGKQTVQISILVQVVVKWQVVVSTPETADITLKIEIDTCSQNNSE